MSDLLYSDVEEQLRSSVRNLLADRAPWPAVLARTETDELYDPALWRSLAVDLGAAGLAVPESAAGQGASWRETAVVAEELGRSVAATPFLGSTVMATALAIRAGADDLVKRLASAAVTAALAMPLSTGPGGPGTFPAAVRHSDGLLSGTVRDVADARSADQLLVPCLVGDEPALFVVDAAATRRDAVGSLDLTRPLCDVTFDAAPGELIASGADAVSAVQVALTTGAALLAAEQLGLAQRCLEMTVEHLLTRYQFGRQIGSYQALKHRMADMWAGVTQARAVARYAVTCVADGDPDAAVAASLAQAYCSPVAVRAAEECVQLHGGIGFTWEHPAHLYLKRAKADAIALGTAARHRARLGELVDLPAAG
ncbi:MAG: acyl-CoA dehydrogenase [Pseudonocardiales bacterium]|nr:MAG: acyl-CoA dehydrogenase [Pseudonocardiales bacterium]